MYKFFIVMFNFKNIYFVFIVRKGNIINIVGFKKWFYNVVEKIKYINYFNII